TRTRAPSAGSPFDVSTRPTRRAAGGSSSAPRSGAARAARRTNIRQQTGNAQKRECISVDSSGLPRREEIGAANDRCVPATDQGGPPATRRRSGGVDRAGTATPQEESAVGRSASGRPPVLGAPSEAGVERSSDEPGAPSDGLHPWRRQRQARRPGEAGAPATRLQPLHSRGLEMGRLGA